jgi:hypothetical protein
MSKNKTARPIIPIIDTREKEKYRYSFGEPFGEPLIKKLDAGDYSIAGLELTLAIERKKTVSEISNNVLEKRFDDWTARLSEYKYAFIVCEFSYFDLINYPLYENVPAFVKKKIRMNGQYLASRLIGLNMKYPNINLIYAGSQKYAEALTETIMLKVYNECK